MPPTYRKGPVGALMDEYERAAGELARVLAPLSAPQYEEIRDAQTQDECCRSIQTILSHVVSSGYGYANAIRRAYGGKATDYTFRILSRGEVEGMLSGMLAYTVDTLSDKFDFTDDQLMAIIVDRYGPQKSDLEQVLEHAIVHILRHRRQIDKFLAQ